MPDLVATTSDPAATLVIRNELSALREMSAWLEATIQRLEVPEPLVFKFDLCANEAVTNVISYAYPQNGSHEIGLRLFRENEALCLEIEDDGIPFNPIERPQHAQPASLEEAEIGGLGVDLIRTFMDECHYARRSGRNVLKMVAHIER
jgi:serine/threonine-protein kinase RsbW